MSRRAFRSPLRTLTGQITALVVLAALVGAVLTGATLFWLAYNQKTGMTPELTAASEAARIATIVREARPMGSADDIQTFIREAEAPHEHITLVDLSGASNGPAPAGDSADLKLIRSELSTNWHLQTLFSSRSGAIIVPLDQARGLAFVVSKGQVAQLFILAQFGLAASIILLMMIFLSTYAAHRLTKPLEAFAGAAEAFGRSAEAGETLPATGPLEIAGVASAFNDMRGRVRRLVAERTRMLAAISHDLRTPLTRLRLRTERVVAQQEGREAMLEDIDTIEAMLQATLSYLRDGQVSEAPEFIDLPSFLQTLCDAYADTGHDVTYRGPARFEFVCRPGALKRAVSNIVDNGLRFGTHVTIALSGQAPGRADIEIADDGPGIPAELHDKVFEPYYKVDQARTADGKSFGLGLAIVREIIVRDGGEVVLSNRAPSGLVVGLRLKSVASPGTPPLRNIS